MANVVSCVRLFSEFESAEEEGVVWGGGTILEWRGGPTRKGLGPRAGVIAAGEGCVGFYQMAVWLRLVGSGWWLAWAHPLAVVRTPPHRQH